MQSFSMKNSCSNKLSTLLITKLRDGGRKGESLDKF